MKDGMECRDRLRRCRERSTWMLWAALATQIVLVYCGVRSIAYMKEWLRLMNPSHPVPQLALLVMDYRWGLWLLPVLTAGLFWKMSARPVVGWREAVPTIVLVVS